jgi:predicted MPP superfamily phosphohydrolase
MIRYAIIALMIVSSGHVLLHYSLTQFYHMGESASAVLGTALAGLTTAYAAAATTIRKSGSPTNKAAYIALSLWLGVGLNLTIAAAATWLLSIPISTMDEPMELSTIYTPLAIASIFYSAYGIWNAFNPRVKEIRVNIKGLPAHWNGKAIVHIADLHIGHTFGPRFLKKLVAKINHINPDIVAITGDLNDGMPCSFLQKIQPMKDLHTRNKLFVTGNHDWRDLDTVIPALERHGITIMDNRLLEINGLQIIGIGCNDPKQDDQDLLETISAMKEYRHGKPTILLRHIPVEITKAKDLGIHLQLSGHSHNGQLFPFHLMARQIYGRYHYGLHSDGNFNIHVTCGVGAWGPPMRTSGFSEIAVIRIN